MKHHAPVICLTIAGSDSSGGAGLQADLKTFAAHSVYGASVVTLITAQNTLGVHAAETLSPELIRAQLNAVLSDLEVRAIKIGALLDIRTMEVVADALSAWQGRDLVLDPVMVSKHGDRLMDAHAEDALIRRLIPRARLITPNRHEAQILLGRELPLNNETTRAAAEELADRLQQNVLITGGASHGDTITDWLVTSEGTHANEAPRVQGRHQHGAGCTLAAAITARLALDDASSSVAEERTSLSPQTESERIRLAYAGARDYLQRAMESAPTIGAGEGPLWHAVAPARD